VNPFAIRGLRALYPCEERLTREPRALGHLRKEGERKRGNRPPRRRRTDSRRHRLSDRRSPPTECRRRRRCRRRSPRALLPSPQSSGCGRSARVGGNRPLSPERKGRERLIRTALSGRAYKRTIVCVWVCVCVSALAAIFRKRRLKLSLRILLPQVSGFVKSVSFGQRKVCRENKSVKGEVNVKENLAVANLLLAHTKFVRSFVPLFAFFLR